MDMPLMMFLHGPGQSPPVWQDVVAHINPDQPMVAPWLKGLKPNDDGGFYMETAAAAVVDQMETRGAQKADLIGFSLGGLVALHVARTYPERVAHLVLISTPIVPSQKVLSRQWMAVKLMPASAFKGVPKKQVLEALDALRHANVGVDLTGVHAPILAIAAEDDATGRSSAEAFRNELGATVRLLPGSDPTLVKTDPGTIAQLVSDFCADFLDPEDT